MSGKGSSRRPTFTPLHKFREAWDRTFGKWETTTVTRPVPGHPGYVMTESVSELVTPSLGPADGEAQR